MPRRSLERPVLLLWVCFWTAVTQALASTIPITSPATPPSGTPAVVTVATYSGCGGEIIAVVGDRGVVTSPGYPEQYTAGLDCDWTIEATEGMRLQLSVVDFEVTATDHCGEDYLELRWEAAEAAAPDSNVTRLCGGMDNVAPTYTSDSNVVTLVLHTSQHGETCKGFKIIYHVQEVSVSCGAEVSHPQFLFRHPRAPSPLANTTADCHLTIAHECGKGGPGAAKSPVPVCQIRLDFLYLVLQPPQLGECEEDQLLLQGGPTLCGNNTGQHVYLDVSGYTSTSLRFVTSPILPRPVGHNDTTRWEYEIEDNRGWTVRVTQLPCGCSVDTPALPTAPRGCRQYHTGVTGLITSYNFHGTRRDLGPCWNGTEPDCGRTMWTGHLNHLRERVCVQQREGYCGIAYQPTGPDAFLLTGQASHEAVENRKNRYGSGQCQTDYLVVAKSRTPGDNDPWAHDRFCGLALGNYVRGPIVSYSPPFVVEVITDEDEFTASVDTQNRGYQLRYTQLPCGAPHLFNGDQKYSG